MYIQLFLSFLRIGLFSVGGGYAAMPLIEAQVVTAHSWLTAREFADLVALSEMTPGPIAINAATFVGTRVGGIAGALVATLGCVLPAFFIVLALSSVYARSRRTAQATAKAAIDGVLGGLSPAIVGLIASAALTILLGSLTAGDARAALNTRALILFILAFVAVRKTKFSPIAIMLACGLAGGLMYAVG